jgi:glycosyltransferase involved in cell wall biosynthesis
MTRLTVLICTHNRAALLARTLYFLNQCRRPADVVIDIVVVANACTDATAALLDTYPAIPPELSVPDVRGGTLAQLGATLPLHCIVEPTPGKSHALNRSLASVDTDLIAMVDDDHRVDRGYLEAVASAAAKYPDATMFCGRILPDWDGTEPAWVHWPTPFPVYPLPVPQYDHGFEERGISLEGPIPGGGNLVLRQGVFARTGPFSVDLGPVGHNLGGSEDGEFVQRALRGGERLRYWPSMLQYHYVDSERLTLLYIMRKAHERSRAVMLVSDEHARGIPRFLYRKLGHHLAGIVFSLYWPERRFHLVRAAATLGEMRGLAVKRKAPGAAR